MMAEADFILLGERHDNPHHHSVRAVDQRSATAA